MRVINIGSLNVDHVYQVDHFARPGESLISRDYRRFAGGKGGNQSLAIARAGGRVMHAGRIGHEGEWMLAPMQADGVDTSGIVVSPDEPGGHTMIQVDPSGENCIVVYGGTNQELERSDVDAALSLAVSGDIVALQNEVNVTEYAMRQAAAQSLRVSFNAAPFTRAILGYPLDLVWLFFINETEGRELTGGEGPQAILDAMTDRFPDAEVVLTLGEQGAVWARGRDRVRVQAVKAEVVDTTGAGDTFIGYTLAGLCEGMSIEGALTLAAHAAAICVSRAGAAASIPYRRELPF